MILPPHLLPPVEHVLVPLVPVGVDPQHDQGADHADHGTDDVEDDPGGDVGEDSEAGEDDQEDHDKNVNH